jgi:chromosome partitioning protein
MRLRRRDRDQPQPEAEVQAEERFFEEPEADAQVKGSERSETPVAEAAPRETVAEELSLDETQPVTGGPESAQVEPVIVEAESADAPVDFILEPPRTEGLPEEPSPVVEAARSVIPEAEAPFIPPLPKNPNRGEKSLAEPAPAVSLEAEPAPAVSLEAEPAPAVSLEAEPAPEAEAPVEPVPVAPARAGAPNGNFTERAQMAIGRLGELPATNGAHKTRALPRVVAIANQKGGVGKTTTTVNLGAALSELDYRVLVVDLDPQGNATSGLGIDTRNFEASMYDVIMRDAPIEDCIEPTSVQNLFVTPATIDLAGVEIELVSAFSRELKLKRAIDTVVDDFDFILIDCPPSLGLLTVNGLAAATEVLVPIQCEYYALEGLSQLLRNVQLVAANLNVGLEISTIVLTMFDARTRLAVDVADEVRSHFKEVVCRSIIPRSVRLSEAPSFGQPITVFDPSSRGAVAYRELAKEVSDGAPKRSG